MWSRRGIINPAKNLDLGKIKIIYLETFIACGAPVETVTLESSADH
jgi:hypothetical protein